MLKCKNFKMLKKEINKKRLEVKKVNTTMKKLSLVLNM